MQELKNGHIPHRISLILNGMGLILGMLLKCPVCFQRDLLGYLTLQTYSYGAFSSQELTVNFRVIGLIEKRQRPSQSD